MQTGHLQAESAREMLPAARARGNGHAAGLGRSAIGLALFIAVVGYAYDLRALLDATALETPLRRAGQRALALSLAYAALLVAGFW